MCWLSAIRAMHLTSRHDRLGVALYGGMYNAVALLWMKFVDGVLLIRRDALGATITLIDMAAIALQPRTI